MNRHRAVLRELQKKACNKECADCISKGPLWASANLGVFLCIRCAGIHRKLGTHISFVRSVNLDSWKDKHINIMRRVGNKVAREYYEYRKPSHIKKLSEHASAENVEEYIRAKYERRIWVRRKEDEDNDDDGSDSEYESEEEKRRVVVEKKRIVKRNPPQKKKVVDKKPVHDTPLLSFDQPQKKDLVSPNTFVAQLFDGVGRNNQNNTNPRLQKTNGNFLSSLLEVEEEITTKKRNNETRVTNTGDFFVQVGSRNSNNNRPSPGGNGNGNGNGGEQLMSFNQVNDNKKDRIMKMFEKPSVVAPQLQQPQQPKSKRDPNEPSFMKWFDQPQVQRPSSYNNQHLMRNNQTYLQTNNINYYRNNHHVRYSSPQSLPTTARTRTTSATPGSFNYVPKGRSVPVNFRANNYSPNYNLGRNKNSNSNTNSKQKGADSFF